MGEQCEVEIDLNLYVTSVDSIIEYNDELEDKLNEREESDDLTKTAKRWFGTPKKIYTDKPGRPRKQH